MILTDMDAVLKPLGYPIYAPGEYTGKCQVPYLVIKRGGTSAANKPIQGYAQVDVILYTPLYDYRLMDSVCARVKRALSAVSGCGRPESVGPDMIESEYGAYSRTLTYRIAVTFD